MNNSKARNQLFRPHIVMLLLLVVGNIITLASLLNTGRQMEALYNESYVIRNAVSTIEATFETMQKTVFRAASNNSKDSANAQITNVNSTAIIAQQMAIIKQGFPGNMGMVSRLEEYLAELAPMWENALGLAAQNKSAEAAGYMESNNLPLIEKARKELVLIIEATHEKENHAILSLQATQRSAIVLLVALGIASLLFTIGVGIAALGGCKNKRKGREGVFSPMDIL